MSDVEQAPQSAFPIVIYNPPGLSAITYRIGDFASFREALLQSRLGEVELKGWRPTADDDLGLQLLEWWAYLADILTFYNERIANDSYLGTSVLPATSQPQTGSPAPSAAGAGFPDNPSLIAQASGYQSTPGIAATGPIAVLVNSPTPISLPPPFAVQSKPGPGQQPQVFETTALADNCLPNNAGGVVVVDVSKPTYFVTKGVSTNATPGAPAEKAGPLLSGTISSIKPNDVLVVAPIAPPFAYATSAPATAKGVKTEVDPRGRANTRLQFQSFDPPAAYIAGNAASDVTNYQVLRSAQSVPVYSFGGAPGVSGLTPGDKPTGVHLASLVRDIAVGDLVVLEAFATATASTSGLPTYISAAVHTYEDTIWYANADDSASAPQDVPAGSKGPYPTEVAIPIPHSFLTLDLEAIAEVTSKKLHVTRVLYGFQRVSALLDEFPASIPTTGKISDYVIQASGSLNTTALGGATVLLEGADGVGAIAALGTPLNAGKPIQLSSWSIVSPLTMPMRMLFNVVAITAGKTVTNEILGSGDGTLASQSFTLQKSPLTYLSGANPNSPVSTLQVLVDNVAWTEAPNFHGQPADAKIFVTRRDKNQNTSVTFGDGINGARLTTGAGNVTATYRYGNGPGDPSQGGPAQGTLVTVLTPYPGLGSVRNPVPMTGGAAPSTPTQVQQNAAASVLTFGRAVSSRDYEAIATQAPSVERCRAVAAWDPKRRRTVFTVYVAGSPDAVSETAAALLGTVDPNYPVIVSSAFAIALDLSFIVLYDRSFDPAAIKTDVIAALTDPNTGLFSPSQMAIGATLYDSQIYAACRKVAGVTAIRGLIIRPAGNPASSAPANARLFAGVAHTPPAGGFFQVRSGDVNVTMEASDG